MMTVAKVIKAKIAIISLFESGQVHTMTGAARLLGISPLAVYGWKRRDLKWAESIEQVDQIIADKLEEELEQALVMGKVISMPYVTARIFRLKALRPKKYKDNFKLEVTDVSMKNLLTDLRNLGKQEHKKDSEEPPEPSQAGQTSDLFPLPEE